MRPDQLPQPHQLPCKEATIKQQSSLDSLNLNNIAGGGDNIITISTASINECRPDEQISEDLEQIKQSAFKQSEKLVQFRSKQHLQQQTAAPTSVTQAAAQPINKKKLCSNLRKIEPSRYLSFQNNIAEVHHRKGRRLHGLQLPLHPLQILGWLVLLLFGLACFCILIPSFSAELQGPLYGLIAGLYIVHIVSHLSALLIDPADKELRRIHRNDRIVPEFDRSKHTHVIENGRCHLCNIRTSSPRTKHCSVCNKCVGKFDHHCKWLNHCIGSRNYVAFLMCVVSAVIATLVIVAAVIAQLVLYYVHPQWLSFWYSSTSSSSYASLEHNALGNLSASYNNSLNLNDSLASNYSYLSLDDALIDSNLSLLYNNLTELSVETALNQSAATTAANLSSDAAAAAADGKTTGIGLNDTIFLILISVLGLLAAITAGLLLHLCFFHIYISFLGLTTYEYIRNHRAAQEAAKTKKQLSSLSKNGVGSMPAASSPASSATCSKKTKDCSQIYFCSSLRHPNSMARADRRYFETHQTMRNRASRLHCCANSREYHHTASRTYYMCSLLEEGQSQPSGIAHISGGSCELYDGNSELSHNDELSDSYQSFHCCSTFAASATQRRVSAATNKATLISDLESTAASLSAARQRAYVQFTEQCTFCSFRIRSPMLPKRSASANTHTRSTLSTRTHSNGDSASSSQNVADSNSAAAALSSEQQKCCMKSISKNQRWRRKWNCCANVPDSPDVPNDIITALAIRHQHSLAINNAKVNASELPVQFVKSVNGAAATPRSSSGHSHISRPISPRSASLKAQSRVRNARTWPLARLRHMMRMLNRRPRCRHTQSVANASTNTVPNGSCEQHIKQNQIRPLQLQAQKSSDCTYYDSSSPQPASSTSDEHSLYSDSAATTPCNRTSEIILPTSIIRGDNCNGIGYSGSASSITLPPALPPPQRRKIPNPTDLDDLAETLAFVASGAAANASHDQSASIILSPSQRLPTINNVYRRRRKHFLRTRSPTLSPIHESGLSNPTSPQLSACRHNASGSSSCSPVTAVNKFCSGAAAPGSSELKRKMASNSSLHSVSSNSSST